MTKLEKEKIINSEIYKYIAEGYLEEDILYCEFGFDEIAETFAEMDYLSDNELVPSNISFEELKEIASEIALGKYNALMEIL